MTILREEIKTFLIGLDWDAKPDYIVDEILKIFEKMIDTKFLKYEKETPFLGDEDIQKDAIDFLLAELKEELRK